MTTSITRKFSPSVNIIRDVNKDLDYIPTPNAQLVFSQITSEFILGVRSFSIIGAYGTGKSSFLWAFEKVINQKNDYFPLNPFFQDLEGFETVNLVGEYASMLDFFAHEFNLKGDYTSTEVIKAIDKFYKKHEKKKRGIVIFVDEFGKLLEYAAKNIPEQELYFIQQLAEYVNDLEKNIFLITTLHQDFNSYSFGLSRNQRNEWSKVKGRLKEITFNEPVEQLLYLASERLEKYPNKPKKDKNFERLFKVIRESKAFPLRDYLNEDIAEKLLPFDILAASLLTLALQKYGQNERSLFSFIESNDHFGLNDFSSEGEYFSISNVYDYLIHNYAILNTKYNPHNTQWAALRSAIERVEGLIEEDTKDALTLVKTIGLLNTFASSSANIDNEFLEGYGKLSLGIKQPSKVLKNLERYKIIRFVSHSQKYILFEGTDLDIELAIDEAGNLIEKVTNVVTYLNTYFDFPCILAKAAYYKYGTPRFFEFKLSEEPIDKEPIGEIDGFINLIFSENLKAKDIEEISKKCNKAIIYGWYKNTHEIRKLIFEIQKVQKVIETNQEDKVAIRELQSILNHQVRLLNHYVLGSIYSNSDAIQWFFEGSLIHFKSQKEFNRILSQICESVYPHTPKFRSEMVNKTKISSPIATAQKNLIRAVVENWDKPYLGIRENAFPPEKSIFLSLLHDTGLLRSNNGAIGFNEPTETSFKPLWDICQRFLDSSTTGKRNLRELIDILSTKPLKLKKGFIDFWLPIYLFAKREDFALFEKDIYIPYVNDQVLEVVSKNPHKYFIKAFDIEGINLTLFKRYREVLNQKDVAPSNQSFIETIRPFLTFYKSLPDYSKGTKNLPKPALNLRGAIAKATSPEQIFFEDFPTALGYNLVEISKDENLLDEYIFSLQQSIKQIRTAYEGLKDRFESNIVSFLALQNSNFEVYRNVLQKRFVKIKTHFLKQHQRVFLQRVISDLDRNAWLSSVSQACIGKTLENINDADEPLLHDRFIELVQELDNLYELSKAKTGNDDDDFVLVEISELESGNQKRIIRMSGTKKSAISKQEKGIESILGQDTEVNIAALAKLLKKLLDE